MKCYLFVDIYYYITLGCIWLNSGVTIAFPEPLPGDTVGERCGSQTCHPKGPIPQFCNSVEGRCETCNVKTCLNKICGDWAGCQTTTPVTIVPLPGTTRKSNETLATYKHELKELQHKVDYLEATIKNLVFGVVALGVVVAVFIALVCQLRCRLHRINEPSRRSPDRNRGSPSGTIPSTENHDPDETSPMTLQHINDSGIMNSDNEETSSERGDNRVQSSQQRQGAVSHRTDGHVDRPRGIPPETCIEVESQADGKPTSMVF